MNNKYIFLVLLLPISVYGSESTGVEAANYEAGVGYSTGNLFDSYDLSGTANLPVNDLLGSNIIALASKTDGKRYGSSRGLDS
ncbi:hypothetical protein, partial [Kaarinaea lacus]